MNHFQVPGVPPKWAEPVTVPRSLIINVGWNELLALESPIRQNISRPGVFEAVRFISADDHAVVVDRSGGGLYRMWKCDFGAGPVSMLEPKSTASTRIERASDDNVRLIYPTQYRAARAGIIQSRGRS